MKALRSQQITPHVCPASNIRYTGSCPVLSCPANLSQISRGSKTGCYFTVGKRTQITDICLATGQKSSDVRADYNYGLKHFEELIELHKLVEKLRQADMAQRCVVCGITKTGNIHTCFNGIRCRDRATLVKFALKRYPLSIPGLQLTRDDFWRMMELDASKNPLIHKWFSDRVLRKAQESLNPNGDSNE